MEPEDSLWKSSSTSYTLLPEFWSQQGKLRFGVSTYQLEVLLPQPIPERLALRLPVLHTAYRLYIDDTRCSGEVGRPPTSQAGFRPMVSPFTPKQSRFVITLQISNHDYWKGGMGERIFLGTDVLARTAPSAALPGSLPHRRDVPDGALSLSIFSLRRRNRAALTLFCVLVGLYTLLNGDYFCCRSSRCSGRQRSPWATPTGTAGPVFFGFVLSIFPQHALVA